VLAGAVFKIPLERMRVVVLVFCVVAGLSILLRVAVA
jgi:hypothetical protein